MCIYQISIEPHTQRQRSWLIRPGWQTRFCSRIENARYYKRMTSDVGWKLRMTSDVGRKLYSIKACAECGANEPCWLRCNYACKETPKEHLQHVVTAELTSRSEMDKNYLLNRISTSSIRPSLGSMALLCDGDTSCWFWCSCSTAFPPASHFHAFKLLIFGSIIVSLLNSELVFQTLRRTKSAIQMSICCSNSIHKLLMSMHEP